MDRQNKILSIFLSLLYIFVMAKPFIPLLIYYTNKEYIATELCVNKDRPEMNCHGKCQLKKMYEVIDYCPKEEHNNDQQIPVKIEFSVFPLPKSISYSVFIYQSRVINNISYVKSFHAFELIDSIFHPPKVFLIIS